MSSTSSASFVCEEDEDCPLCMEEMDFSDKHFRPCPCGYQVCRFCWHRLREEQEKGKCPACRRPYTEEGVQFTPVPPEELERLKQRKKTTREKRDNLAAIIAERQHLSELRVIQRNLVYVIGVSMKLADEKTLREPHFFGQFGRITKIVVNKKAYGHGANCSASAYITYTNGEDAKRAMEAVDGSVYDGRVLRATYGTTKYCSFFLRGLQCNNSECLYLHELGDQTHSFSKEQMTSTKQHLQSFMIDSKDSQGFRKFGIIAGNAEASKSKSPPPPGLDDDSPRLLHHELFVDRAKKFGSSLYSSANVGWFLGLLRSLCLPVDVSIFGASSSTYTDNFAYTRDLLTSAYPKSPTVQASGKLKFETKAASKKIDVQPVASLIPSSSPSSPPLASRNFVTHKSSAASPSAQSLRSSNVLTQAPTGIKSKNIFNLLENEEPVSISTESTSMQSTEPLFDNVVIPSFKMTVVKRPPNLEEADKLLKDIEGRSEKSRKTVSSLEEQVKSSMAALSLK